MKKTRAPFLRLIPEIWKYQIITKLFFAPLLAAFHMASRLAQNGLPLPWQICVPLFVLAFGFCVAVDLNVKILYAGNVLDGTTEPLPRTIKKAVTALPKCLRPQGLGVVLYILLAVPAAGLAAGLWEIPYLATIPLYYLLHAVPALLFAAFGITHVFCLHGLLLDGLSVGESCRRSGALIQAHRTHFLGQNFICGLSIFAIAVLMGILFFLVPFSLGVEFLPQKYNAVTVRSLMILLLFLNAALFIALALLATPYYFISMTKLYREYLTGMSVTIPARAARHHPVAVALAVFYVLEIAALSSQTTYNFDERFPPLTATRIVAHRGGGNENAENTRSGLETAVFLGAYGSEIDIQRTLDGRYIVNHDATFERVAGDSRTPSEMTLEEIQQLRYPVPTLEEMLDAAKGRIVLFIELKGDTADQRMCQDAVKLIQERDMEAETVLISFREGLIEYIENRWPEIQTGYLTFLSPGETLPPRFDYLGLAENSATVSVIDAVHAQGRKVFVWTPNSADTQEYFLIAGADAVITDNVSQADSVSRFLNDRNGLESVLSVFRQP